MLVISGLLGWLATYRQGNGASKFALRLFQSETDFNEPVRQKLSMLCKEYGILCLIEKLRKDRSKTPIVHMRRGRGGKRSRGRGGSRGNEHKP